MSKTPTVLAVLEHPTQFDAPFFRWVAAHGGDLKVIYLRGERARGTFFDPELDMSVSWHQDLAAGYPNLVLPSGRRGRRLIRTVAKLDADLVIVAGYRSPLLMAAAVTARLRGCLVALRLDTVSFSREARARRVLKRILYLFLQGVFQKFLGVGSASREFLLGIGVPAARIGRFPYSVDVAEFQRRATLTSTQRVAIRRQYGLAPDRFVVLSVAKHSAREAPWDLLRAAAGGALQDTQLWLVGDGPDRSDLEKFADSSRCEAVFSGYVSFGDLPMIYGAADVFVHPVQYEPWGVSVQEAMACGLPAVVSSRVGSAHDLISDGQNGFVYRVGDPSDLRSKLIMLTDRLDPGTVRSEHARRLGLMSYEATWKSLQSAARTR